MVTLTPHKGGEGIELEFSSEVDAGRNGDIFSTAIVTSLTRGAVFHISSKTHYVRMF